MYLGYPAIASCTLKSTVVCFSLFFLLSGKSLHEKNNNRIGQNRSEIYEGRRLSIEMALREDACACFGRSRCCGDERASEGVEFIAEGH